MPQGEHSLLQATLCQLINQISQPQQIALALPKLRCVFGDVALVPDIAVFRWQRIPKLSSGRIANRFDTYSDWMIEILSPEQRYKQVLNKLLLTAEHGTELGWLVDPADQSILIVDNQCRVREFTNQDCLPVLTGIELNLTAIDVFNCLML